MDTSTLVSSVAAILTTASFFPQALKTIRTKDTKSISLIMYLVFNLGILMWLAYGLLEVNWPIIMANGVTFVFTFVILVMKIKYK
jgi:MtN3 and saliva related transmembrane protein